MKRARTAHSSKYTPRCERMKSVRAIKMITRLSPPEPKTEDKPRDDLSCQKCRTAEQPEWILLCDKCDEGWHAACLRPPLLSIPEGDWYCPPCQHVSCIFPSYRTLQKVREINGSVFFFNYLAEHVDKQFA